ncbi:MAG: LptF/LptG family permease [Candidatus Omnitrophica bacterium]|nr:LptF/LptG family permease [Candidatus Omnitrophota bacterium]
MKLEKRYFFEEFGNFFVMALLIFPFLFMISPLMWFMDLIINHFFTVVTAGKFFIYSFLENIPDIFSLAFLTAMVGTIARMNMEKEYWIFLTSGISAKHIFNFFAFFAVLFVIVEFWLCFFVSPSAMFKKKLLLNQARLDEPFKIFRRKSLITEFPGLSIYVADVLDRQLMRISISYREGSNLVCRIVAESATLITDKKGYLYLSLKNGFIETHSTKKLSEVLKVSVGTYIFHLPYRKISGFQPYRKVKEMSLPLLIRASFSSISSRDAALVIIKKLFFTSFPVFYLFLGFYAGIRIKASGYLQILGAGLSIGLASYFVILFGEAAVYKTGITAMFLVAPLSFITVTLLIRRKFSNVT